MTNDTPTYREIQYIPVDQLHPAEYNPRQMSEGQYERLKASIQQFGMPQPLIVNTHKNRRNVIVGGHQRWRIAQELGWDDVPCITVSVTPEQEKELNLRLNKNSGEWDWDMLANHYEVDFLKDMGFSSGELQVFNDPVFENLDEDIQSESPLMDYTALNIPMREHERKKIVTMLDAIQERYHYDQMKDALLQAVEYYCNNHNLESKTERNYE